jgi:hypothetical protein
MKNVQSVNLSLAVTTYDGLFGGCNNHVCISAKILHSTAILAFFSVTNATDGYLQNCFFVQVTDVKNEKKNMKSAED